MRLEKINVFIKRVLSIFCLIQILLNISAICFADDRDEEDFENETFINEFKREKNNIPTLSNQGSNLTLNSKKYVILDRKSGLCIYGKDEKKQTAMASTTKIMTRYSCFGKLQKYRGNCNY